MQQYMALAKTGELLDARKQFNYAQAMDKITIPVLISCGEEDQLAPPPVQRYLYDHVGSADKMLVIFGRSTGLSASAGHNDSLVGMNSRDQVYPIIESWLSGARAPRR
jgi:esterase/lipase